MNMRKALFTTVCILTMAGCTNHETRVTNDKLSSLNIGKSTEAEILKIMGNPTSTTVNAGGSKTLEYSEEKHQKKKSGGERTQSKFVILDI